METIFDIFGSRDSVKLPSRNPLPQKLPTVKGILSTEGVQANKPITKTGGLAVKGKKVLGDVGNKIKGMNVNSEGHSNETMKKPLQESSNAKFLQKANSEISQNVEKCTLQDTPSLQLTQELYPDDKNMDKLPEVELQGPTFWPDDDHDCMWPVAEIPCVDDFRNAINIWDIGITYPRENSPSPLPEEFKDDTDFCIGLPSIPMWKDEPCDLELEEMTIPFPWEI